MDTQTRILFSICMIRKLAQWNREGCTYHIRFDFENKTTVGSISFVCWFRWRTSPFKIDNFNGWTLEFTFDYDSSINDRNYAARLTRWNIIFFHFSLFPPSCDNKELYALICFRCYFIISINKIRTDSNNLLQF